MCIVALDIFCGAGGVTCGLRKAGITVAVGVDSNEDCRLTFTQNNPAVRFIAEDIRKLSVKQLLSYTQTLKECDFLLLAACAPCQPFSAQNRQRHMKQDRAILSHVERLVKEMKPDFLFLENVPGLRKVRGFSAFRRLTKTLGKLGYSTNVAAIDAAQFGVPQHRVRLVLTGSLHGRAPWPAYTHGDEPSLEKFRNVHDAISRYPTIKAGEEHPTLPNHIAARLEPHNIIRLKSTPRNGGSRTTWSPNLVLKCHKNHDGHQDVYGRLRWEVPAPTLTTKCTSLSNGRYGHPEQDRAISVREAASLQSFEDSYMFYGGLKQITMQIGNAVPPRLAEVFGNAFVEYSKKLKKSSGGLARVLAKRRPQNVKKRPSHHRSP
jgi:DNA (cytosine-5)-methyltransferase 1